MVAVANNTPGPDKDIRIVSLPVFKWWEAGGKKEQSLQTPAPSRVLVETVDNLLPDIRYECRRFLSFSRRNKPIVR
ncbi:heme biosynthesis protein HemY [Anopheles sinensis]|uniref:Heme biosynthesis protein HemY n=1 Tax=Anopheles sinensis TaxID=74873 RepID=A0A084W2A3_ANOSI|nr:heme biosynthesis protein HemY [Anopheles sinensis]